MKKRVKTEPHLEMVLKKVGEQLLPAIILLLLLLLLLIIIINNNIIQSTWSLINDAQPSHPFHLQAMRQCQESLINLSVIFELHVVRSSSSSLTSTPVTGDLSYVIADYRRVTMEDFEALKKVVSRHNETRPQWLFTKPCINLFRLARKFIKAEQLVHQLDDDPRMIDRGSNHLSGSIMTTNSLSG